MNSELQKQTKSNYLQAPTNGVKQTVKIKVECVVIIHVAKLIRQTPTQNWNKFNEVYRPTVRHLCKQWMLKKKHKAS